MPMTELQRDLQRYASDKLGHFIADVTQAFDIAGSVEKSEMIACMGSVFGKAAAAIAAACGASKDEYLDYCARAYDHEKQLHDERKRHAQAEAGCRQ